jgi:hypothetical protein
LISSIRARSVSIEGGSGADFLATREDIEQEWLPDQLRHFNAAKPNPRALTSLTLGAGVTLPKEA